MKTKKSSLPRKVSEFKTWLTARLGKIQTLSKQVENEMAPQSPDEAHDILDRSADVETIYTLEPIKFRIFEQQKLLQYALDKIDHGTFGVCESCEESIPLKRLQAQPTARHCIECQEKLDKVNRRLAGASPVSHKTRESGFSLAS
jgi:DnaK suppressor protein